MKKEVLGQHKWHGQTEKNEKKINKEKASVRKQANREELNGNESRQRQQGSKCIFKEFTEKSG